MFRWCVGQSGREGEGIKGANPLNEGQGLLTQPVELYGKKQSQTF